MTTSTKYRLSLISLFVCGMLQVAAFLILVWLGMAGQLTPMIIILFFVVSVFTVVAAIARTYYRERNQLSNYFTEGLDPVTKVLMTEDRRYKNDK